MYNYELGSVLSIQGEEVRIVARSKPNGGKIGYIFHRVGSSFKEYDFAYSWRSVISDKNRAPSFWESCLDLKTSDECGVMLDETELNILGAKMVSKYKYELGTILTIQDNDVKIVARANSNNPHQVYLVHSMNDSFKKFENYFGLRTTLGDNVRKDNFWESSIDLKTSDKISLMLYDSELEFLGAKPINMAIEYKYNLGEIFTLAGEEVILIARAQENGKPQYLLQKTSGRFSPTKIKSITSLSSIKSLNEIRNPILHKDRLSSFWKERLGDLTSSGDNGIHLYQHEIETLLNLGSEPKNNQFKYEYELGTTFTVCGEEIRIVSRSKGFSYLFERVSGDYKVDSNIYYGHRMAYKHNDRNDFWKDSLSELSKSNKTGVHLYKNELSNLISNGTFKLKSAARKFKSGDPITVNIGGSVRETKVHDTAYGINEISYINPEDGEVYWANVTYVSHREITEKPVKAAFKPDDPISIYVDDHTTIYTEVNSVLKDQISYLVNGVCYWVTTDRCNHDTSLPSYEKKVIEKDMSDKRLCLGDYVTYNDVDSGAVFGSVVALKQGMCLLALSNKTSKNFGLHNGITRISGDISNWIVDSRFEKNSNFHNCLLDSSTVKEVDLPFANGSKVEVKFDGQIFQSTVLGNSITENDLVLIDVPNNFNFSNQHLYENVDNTKWNRYFSRNFTGKKVSPIHIAYLTKLSPNSKENAMDKDSSTAVSFVARQKSRVAKGVYRAEARQLAKGTRAILVTFLKSQGFKRNEIKFATAMLENPIGLPILSWGIGELINRTPGLRDNPHCKILEEELQIEAFASGMDLGLDSIREKFEPMVLGILSRLPTPPAEMLRVADEPKARVSTPVNVEPERDMMAEQEAMADVKKSVATASV